MAKTNWHAEELTLLAAIHAKPRDDTPRLIYADWLGKNGQSEFAEFIRLQCSQEPDILDSKRADELRRSFGREWAGWMPPSFDCTYERGLPLTWLKTNLWTLERLTNLLAKISPRLRFIMMLKEQTLFHKKVGPAVFEHPIMSRVARFRVCPVEGRKANDVAFVQRLATFRLPETVEVIDFFHLNAEAEKLSREIFEPRYLVTVQCKD